MTKEREALKLALEALETADEIEFWNKQKEAIAAIKEALAQPTLGYAKKIEELIQERDALRALAQPAQEPDELTIAYMSGLYDGKKKRPWVGLTDEEINDAWKKWVGTDRANKSYTLAIEAALRSKNT